MTNDRLEQVWRDQREFNSRLLDHNRAENDAEYFKQWNAYYHLALMREAGEVLDTTKWKVHRNDNSKTIDRGNTLEELIDVFKYWLSIAQLHGFTADELIDAYWRKSAVVEQRFQQEHDTPINGGAHIKPVAMVDIDGVLADWRTGYASFLGRDYNWGIDYIQELCGSDNYDIGAEAGLTKEQDVEYKRLFRSNGGLLGLKPFGGARMMLRSLQALGYRVVLLTSRPYHEHTQAYSDTVAWLKREGMSYDALLFDEDKVKRLAKEGVLPFTSFAVEDVTANANSLAAHGIPTVLMNRSYNLGQDQHISVTRCRNYAKAVEQAVRAKTAWDEKEALA